MFETFVAYLIWTNHHLEVPEVVGISKFGPACSRQLQLIYVC